MSSRQAVKHNSSLHLCDERDKERLYPDDHPKVNLRVVMIRAGRTALGSMRCLLFLLVMQHPKCRTPSAVEMRLDKQYYYSAPPLHRESLGNAGDE
jgi:hypothetical protein